MKKNIVIRIESKSKKAIEWAIECLEETISQEESHRRWDTDDPEIKIEIVKRGKK